MARPTRLDDLTAQRIIKALQAGVSRRGAAEAANISQTTLFAWLARGRDDEAPFAEFLERVEAAEAKVETKMVGHILAAAEVAAEKGDHRPALAWLERRRGQDWAAKAGPVNEQALVGASSEAEDLAVAESVVEAIKSRKAV